MSGAQTIALTSNTSTNSGQTTDGTSQLVFAGNPRRTGMRIECPVSTTLNASGNSIFVNEAGAAGEDGTSYEVTPGGYYPPPGLPLFLGDVFVKGVSGIKFIAKEYT